VTPHDWDAATYERVAGGVVALGQEVVGRLPLRGDETVLDAGCGPGGVTAALLERLPRGRVVAVDSSPTMIAAARERFAGDDRVRFEVANLLELELERQVDAVLSTATFHWIADHERLFERLHAALRPGGRLVAQCGAAGNIAEVMDATAAVVQQPEYAAHLGGFSPKNYATPAETEPRLLAAGFAEAQCWTEDRPITPDDPAEYLRAVMLGAHVERLPEQARAPFVAAVLERLIQPVIFRYVRLNIDAVA
jgi:trans-aconitate 2-methyltransferase